MQETNRHPRPFNLDLPLSCSDFEKRITKTPRSHCFQKTSSPTDRIDSASLVYDCYVPPSTAYPFYQAVYRGLTRSMRIKYSPKIKAQARAIYETYEKHPHLDIIGPDIPLILLRGDSGAGKTALATRVLSLFNQVERSVNAGVGKSVQINYLYVEYPYNGTLRSLLLTVLAEMCRVAGKSAVYSPREKKWRVGDAARIKQILFRMFLGYRVGLLVIDTVSISRTTMKSEEIYVFFRELVLYTGTCVILIGSDISVPEPIPLMTKSFQLSAEQESDEWFALLVRSLWRSVGATGVDRLSDETYAWLYDVTDGSPALVCDLLYYGQMESVLLGQELSLDLLLAVRNRYFCFREGML